MNILAIETSCDDTCVAIVKVQGPKFKVKSNVVSSQVEIHKKWGGVYPSLAKREHQRNLPIVLKKAQKEAGNPKIDLITVTVGPGLEPCLWVGVNFAKELAKKLKVPIVPANHIESHILINFLNNKYVFPAVCLVVSGGHTQLILMKGIGKGEEDKSSSSPFAVAREYKVLGETRDDAAGECFDKTARILGLGYPGGPAIAAEAAKFQIIRGGGRRASKFQIKLPRPMINQKNYDFSFSGLKTAVLYDFKNRPPRVRKSKEYIRAMAAGIQQAVIDVLIKKTLKAAEDYKAKLIILGGGVAANDELRKQFKFQIQKPSPGKQDEAGDEAKPQRPSKFKILFLVPPKAFCTDNAVMTALTGYYHLKEAKKKNLERIEAKANLRLE